MNRLYSSLIEFLKPKIRSGSILRGVGVLAFSIGTATGVIYTNYLGYWKGTIYRTQTVDFNILANLLPGKISSQLLNKDSEGLQKTLDSNYGLFGIIITDCKSIEVSCPAQEIMYASKSKIKKLDIYKRILVSEDNYTKTWLRDFKNVDSPEERLSSELFIPLYDPPSNQQMWEFTTPRESQINYTGQQNQGKVIGRIYLLRANPPLFTEELQQWLQNPLGGSSKTLVYNAISITAVLTGLFVWLLSELIYHLKLESEKRLRTIAENGARILKEKLAAEEAVQIAKADLYIAIENESKAVKEKLEADKLSELAQSQLTEIEERIKNEKDEVESKLHTAFEENEKLFFEKLEIEVQLDQNSKELERIVEQKNAAEEAARKAQDKLAQATEEKLKAESQDKRTLDRRQKYHEKLKTPTVSSLRISNWLLEFSSEFKSHINKVDRNMQGRILKAISEITEAPMTVQGNTTNPLTKEKRFDGHWRYRIGDYRLIYLPDTSTSTIKFVSFEARQNSYR